MVTARRGATYGVSFATTRSQQLAEGVVYASALPQSEPNKDITVGAAEFGDRCR